MATDDCIIRADFADYRRVKGRKVLQLIMEVRLEEAEEVFLRLGHPIVGESKWCAIALLKNGACASENSGGQRRNAQRPSETSEAGDDQPGNSPASINAPIATGGTSQRAEGPSEAKLSGSPKSSRKWEDMPYSQQAAIRCGEPAFQAFLGVASVDAAAREVRARCGVESRSELDKTGPKSEWREIERLYQLYLTDKQFGEAKR